MTFGGEISVDEAVAQRRSVRAFLPDPVDPALLRRLIGLAARAPSGGNLQPWIIHVLTGARLEAFNAAMRDRLVAGGPDPMEYDIYPKALTLEYRDRSFACGEALYAALGIARDDKGARRAQFARNFQFFGAPVGLFCFVDRQMGPPQWSDLGMYLQTLMLLLTAHGLASCAQECWAVYPRTVATFVGAPEEHMLFCGMAIGRADPDAPANATRIDRVPIDAFVRFHEA